MNGIIRLQAGALVIAALISSFDCAAQVKTDVEILSEIREHPYRAAGNHSPYYAPEVGYTPAPKGYKAFYVSHIGRHGSRYQINFHNVFDKAVALLDSLSSAKSLTAQGDSLKMDLHRIVQAHHGMDGMLTRRGSAEHTAIAERLAARCPSVFSQKDRQTVWCTATTVQRTIQSMAGFIAGLRTSRCGDLEFSIGCGFPLDGYSRPEDKAVEKKMIDSQLANMTRAMSPDESELEDLQKRLFIGYRASVDDLFRLYKACASAGCLDIDADPLHFFTAEELFALYRMYDVIPSIKYGAFINTRRESGKKGLLYLRMILDDADKAIGGNGHCADLRFAHDGNLGPVMTLLGIGGYAYSALEEAPYRYWQSYAQLSMASNLQLEFYRNSRSDIIVKALFNEREINFPGLDAVGGVFYRWTDVRRYILDKCR